jgi:hypothetical protein
MLKGSRCRIYTRMSAKAKNERQETERYPSRSKNETDTLASWFGSLGKLPPRI